MPPRAYSRLHKLRSRYDYKVYFYDNEPDQIEFFSLPPSSFCKFVIHLRLVIMSKPIPQTHSLTISILTLDTHLKLGVDSELLVSLI